MSREESVAIHSQDRKSAHFSLVLTSSPHRVGDHRGDRGSRIEAGREEKNG